MSGKWRHLIFDAVTRQPQAELTVVGSGPTFSDVLNSPGAATFTIPLDPPDPFTLTGDMLVPPRAIYAVEKDDVILWSGPILTHDFDFSARTITMNCEGWWNYVRRRLNGVPGFVFTSTDQTAIVASVLTWLASWVPGDLLITTDPASFAYTGILRDRSYPFYEHQSLGDIIEKLGAVDRGFDWRLVPYWTYGPNSSLGLRFELYYPATGRDSGFVLDLDANATTTAARMDATNLAYSVTIEGQGQGENQHYSQRQSTTEMNAQGIRLEAVESHTDVSVTATLTDYANRRLALGLKPIITPQVEVSTDLYGTIIVGDLVTVRTTGMGLFSRILEVVSGSTTGAMSYRVTQLDVDCGKERMKLTTAPATAF